MSVDINNNTDLETLTTLLPSDVETMKGKGKIDTFNQLLSTDSFPPRQYNIYTVFWKWSYGSTPGIQLQ